MTIPTVAVIPSRYEPDRIRALLEVVRPDCVDVIVLDNGHEPPLDGALDARGMGLYAMWNRGWQMAREHSPVNVAVLNDDILVLPGTLRFMARALRSEARVGAVYPDRHVRRMASLPPSIHLTIAWDPAGSRDLTGYCFMFKGELELPPFDEGYVWWFADTQFDESVRLAGYGVAQVDGVPIEHTSDAETNDWARRPELKAAVKRDGERWAQLHDRIEGGRWVPR